MFKIKIYLKPIAMFNKFRFEVLIQSKSEVDQQFSLGPFHLHGRAGMLNFLLFWILEIAQI